VLNKLEKKTSKARKQKNKKILISTHFPPCAHRMTEPTPLNPHFLSPLSTKKLDSALNLHHHSFISSSLSNSSLSRSRTTPTSPPSPFSPTSASLPTHHQHSSPPSTSSSKLTVKQGARLKDSGINQASGIIEGN